MSIADDAVAAQGNIGSRDTLLAALHTALVNFQLADQQYDTQVATSASAATIAASLTARSTALTAMKAAANAVT